MGMLLYLEMIQIILVGNYRMHTHVWLWEIIVYLWAADNKLIASVNSFLADSNSADFSLFDDLKKKVDLGREVNASLNQYQPVRTTENPYEM